MLATPSNSQMISPRCSLVYLLVEQSAHRHVASWSLLSTFWHDGKCFLCLFDTSPACFQANLRAIPFRHKLPPFMTCMVSLCMMSLHTSAVELPASVALTRGNMRLCMYHHTSEWKHVCLRPLLGLAGSCHAGLQQSSCGAVFPL